MSQSGVNLEVYIERPVSTRFNTLWNPMSFGHFWSCALGACKGVTGGARGVHGCAHGCARVPINVLVGAHVVRW